MRSTLARSLHTMALATLACGALPDAARGQQRAPLTLIAPAAPGGGWDQLARTVARVLERERLTTRVQVQNLAGAAGTIGLARFATAQRGDPNTVLITGLVMIGGIVSNRAPVTLEVTTPLARLVGEYEVIVVPARSPFATLGALLDTFRVRPGAISWGGGSAGGTDQMLVDLIAQHVGVDPRRANYVAFSGGGDAVTALLGDQVTVGVSGYGEFEAHIMAGRLRALAISSRERVPGVNIPTLREAGVPIDLANWRGIVAPPGTRPARAAELIAMLDRMRRSISWQEELARRGWTDLWLSGDAFARFLAAETARVEALAALKRGESAGWLRQANPYRRLTLIGLMAAALLVMFTRRPQTATPESPRQTKALVLVVTGMALNLALIELLGFIIAGATLGWFVACAFGARRPARTVLLSLAGAAATFILFDTTLGVRLPLGILWERIVW